MDKIEWECIKDGTDELDNYVDCYKATDMELVAYKVNKHYITGIERMHMTGKYAPMYNNFGPYFLVGTNPDGTKNIYVGKAGERNEPKQGFKRVKEHIERPDEYFDKWDTCIYITNVNNSMDSAVVLDLERSFIALTKNNNTGKIQSLNGNNGEIGGADRRRWINAYNAILSLLEMPIIGCKLIDRVGIKTDSQIVQQEIIAGSMVNSLSNINNTLIENEDAQKLERYKQIEEYDNIRRELRETKEYEYDGRIYDKTIFKSGNTIYGKKSQIVVTPLPIVQDMISLIPKSVFSSKSKFLCLESKNGVFANAIIDILMSDDSALPINNEEEFSDKSIRLRHIVENMIYAISDLAGLANFTLENMIEHISDIDASINKGKGILETNVSIPKAKHIFNLRNIIRERGTLYTKRIICKQFGINSDIENMKFDVVIGNPPYNNDMYIDFVNLGKELSNEYCCMITPAKWQAKGGVKNEQFRNDIVPYMSKIVMYKDSTDVFNIEEWGGISYYIIENKECKEKYVKNICSKNNSLCSDWEKHTEDKLLLMPNSIKEIIRKLSVGARLGDSCNFSRFTYTSEQERGHYYIDGGDNIAIVQGTKYTGGYLEKEELKTTDKLDKFKVITSCMWGNGNAVFDSTQRVLGVTNMSIVKPNEVPKGSFIILKYFDTEEQCNSFISYMYSKLTAFSVYLGLVGATLNAEFWRFIPDPGAFDHIFTDEELYKKYNLTDEEIAIVESVIKERK